MHLSSGAYALLGLTAIVAVLVSVLLYALLRFSAAARETRRHLGEGQAEHALLSAALAEAVGRLKAQERATAERAEASERLSMEIVESLSSGLIVVGGDRAVQIVNPAAHRLLAIDGQQPLYRPELRPLTAAIDEVLDGGVPVTRRTVSIAAAAGTVFLGVTVSPLRDRDGRVHAAICLFTNLTDAIALEDQLRLKEALARLGELSAGLAHQFRNGLATIQGYAHLLQNHRGADERQQAYVEGIRSESESLGALVSKFLEFARPEALTLEPVDLRAVVDRAILEMPDEAEIEVAGSFGVIDGDEMLLRQAIGNLLRNAVEACTGAGRPPRVTVRGELEPDGRSIQIAVADAGPGIPPEHLSRVFRPFFTTRAQGTGLGLAVVQKVIVGHNGRIVAANHPDGGAIFRIVLPLRKGAASSRKS